MVIYFYVFLMTCELNIPEGLYQWKKKFNWTLHIKIGSRLLKFRTEDIVIIITSDEVP